MLNLSLDELKLVAKSMLCYVMYSLFKVDA